MKWFGEMVNEGSDSEDEDVGKVGDVSRSSDAKGKKGKCMIVDKTCCDTVCPECLEI